MSRLASHPMVRVLALGLALGAAVPAHAGLFDDEEARKAILSMRSQIDQNQQLANTRQAEQAEQIALLKRSILDLNNQLEALRGELARLRGEGEVSGQNLARDVAELQRKQKDMLATLDERFRRLEPQKVSLDGREVTVEQEEKRSYDEAIAILRKGEFGAAATALQAFQRRYPGSAYSGHALYWLGNAQYGKGELKDAMASFRSLVQSQPTHPRAAEALLSIANCQVELKDAKTARKTLDELIKTYPQSEAAQAGRDRLAALR
ncbi:MAG: tol-pal system protein YbgF [Burkholderiales bacterium]